MKIVVDKIDEFIYSLNQEERRIYSILVQGFHYFLDICVCLYPYYFSSTYDIYFAIQSTITIFHWFFLKGECIVSYTEKKMLDKNYIIGSNINNYPYHKIFYNFNNKNYDFIKDFFWIITFILIIFYRKNNKYVKYLYILLFFIVLLKNTNYYYYSKLLINY
jgi:hypothetical protein